MMIFITAAEAQKKLAENLRAQRLALQLTQAGLAQRSGVALPTLRKFEQTGVIALSSFLKLEAVLNYLAPILRATEISPQPFSSIDEVLKEPTAKVRKRGTRL